MRLLRQPLTARSSRSAPRSAATPAVEPRWSTASETCGAMTAVLHIVIDPVAVHLGSLSVHWYGIMYVIAFMAGYRFGV